MVGSYPPAAAHQARMFPGGDHEHLAGFEQGKDPLDRPADQGRISQDGEGLFGPILAREGPEAGPAAPGHDHRVEVFH